MYTNTCFGIQKGTLDTGQWACYGSAKDNNMGIDYAQCDHCRECFPDCGNNYPEECHDHHRVCPWCVSNFAEAQGLPNPVWNWDIEDDSDDYEASDGDVYVMDGIDRFIKSSYCPLCAKTSCPHCGQVMP